MRIGLLDSGIGGLTLLKRLSLEFPENRYIYYADILNAPYGSRNREFLQKVVFRGALSLLMSGAEIIVLACNTASVNTIDFLREKLPLPIVGVFPDLEGAGENALLMCTPSTEKSLRFGGKMQIFADPTLAERIERAAPDFSELEYYLSSKLGVFSPDKVLLGCTHYVFLTPYIENFFGCPCVDGYDGAVSRLEELLSYARKEPFSLVFVGPCSAYEEKYKSIIKI